MNKGRVRRAHHGAYDAPYRTTAFILILADAALISYFIWLDQYSLEVSGDFAGFARPEMKVERVNYNVMTPSSARAVFESILWNPAAGLQPRQH